MDNKKARTSFLVGLGFGYLAVAVRAAYLLCSIFDRSTQPLGIPSHLVPILRSCPDLEQDETGVSHVLSVGSVAFDGGFVFHETLTSPPPAV